MTDPELSDLFLTMVGDARMKASQHSERYKRKFIDTGEKKYDTARKMHLFLEASLQDLLDKMHEVNLNH